jgi:hypothetical protein
MTDDRALKLIVAAMIADGFEVSIKNISDSINTIVTELVEESRILDINPDLKDFEEAIINSVTLVLKLQRGIKDYNEPKDA